VEPSAAEAALGEYIRALKAHRVVVALTILCCVGFALVWTTLRPDTYESSARVLVSPLPGDDSTFSGVRVVRDAGDPTRTVQTAATLLESDEAAARTARLLEPPADAGEIAAAVSIEPLGESNVLAVRATADNGGRAARIANDYTEQALQVRAQTLSSQIERLLSDLRRQQRAVSSLNSTIAGEIAVKIVQLETAQRAGDPTLSLEQSASPGTLTGPSRGLVAVLALLAGVALGTAAAVLLELTRTRVRDEEEATALFPLPVLTRVPRLTAGAIRSAGHGSPDVDPRVQPAFRPVYHYLAEQKRGGRAVALASASTGDGKTTAAVQLARTMALAGESVILIDGDLRSPAVADRLGLEDGGSATDLSSAETTLDESLVRVEGTSLWVAAIPVPASPQALEALVDRLPRLVRAARRRAGFVVVDTPALGEVTDALPLLREVDDVIVVARPGHTDRRTYASLRGLMQRMGAPVHGAVVMGVAPGRTAPRYWTSRVEQHGAALRTRLKSVFER
jgi:Mrp family chromosome partitioning ATPase